MRLADVTMIRPNAVEVGDYVRFGSRSTGLPNRYRERFWKVTKIDVEKEWLHLVNSAGHTDVISIAPSSMNEIYRWTPEI